MLLTENKHKLTKDSKHLSVQIKHQFLHTLHFSQ
jgi:hypothetical protein